MRNTFLLGFLFLLTSQTTLAEQTPAEALISAFGPQCPAVVTRHVQGSMINVNILSDVVRTLRDSDDCLEANALSSAMTGYQGLYEQYEVYKETEHSKLVLEQKMANYVSMASDPSISSELASLLEQEILSAQGDLISMQANLSRFDEISGRYAQGSAQFLNGIQSFLGNWSGNNSCLKEKGPLLNSLLSNSLLVTSAFVAPGTALALGAASVITTSVGNYIRDFKYNEQLKDYDDIKMPTALRCVSSVMADQFCSIEDTKRLIDTYRSDEIISETKFQGIDLLDEHMRSLGHWLQEVYAGSAITSEGDLVNREKPILQAEFLKKVRRYTQTYGTIRTKLYSEIKNERDRSNAVAIGISNLVAIMWKPSLKPPHAGNSPSVENPIFVSRSNDVLPYNLLGDKEHLTRPMCPADSDKHCGSVQQYVNDRGLKLTLGSWAKALSNALAVVDEVLELVNAERARTISVDAYSVLARANADIRGETNAFQGLLKISENAERIAKFLAEAGCRENPDYCLDDGNPRIRHRYYPQIVNVMKTKALTDKVIDLIEEGFIPRSFPANVLPEECAASQEESQDKVLFNAGEDQKAFIVTSCVTKLLKLAERGNDVYFSKVRSMVSNEIEARFALGNDFGQDIDDIVRATRGDLVQSLQNTFGGEDNISLGEIHLGLETSQSVIKNVTEDFFHLFRKQALKSLTEMELSKDEKAALCFRVLPFFGGSGIAKKRFVKRAYKACKNEKLNFYKNGPSIAWRDYISSDYKPRKNIVDRFCALRNYNRLNKLYRRQLGSRPENLLE